VLGRGPNPFRGTASSRRSVGCGPPKLAKNVWGLRCNISRHTAWYGVGVNRWPIGNHPSSMLYRLARSQGDLEKLKIALASDGRPSLPKLSPCYCALHFFYSALSWGDHKKWGGTVKKFFRHFTPEFPPHFWNASSATGCRSYIFVIKYK